MPKHVISRKQATGFTEGEVKKIESTWKEIWEFSDDEDDTSGNVEYPTWWDIPKMSDNQASTGAPATGAPMRLPSESVPVESFRNNMIVEPQLRQPFQRPKLNMLEIVKEGSRRPPRKNL